MSEEDIQEFMNITLQDRRTAMYCLHRHNGNLNLAISYYFDNSYRINIPSDFMNENNQSSTQTQSNSTASSAETQTQHQNPLEELRIRLERRRQQSETQAVSPPPANPSFINARLARDLNRYKKSDPSLFIPFGLPKKEESIRFDDHPPKVINEDSTNSEKLLSCINCECMKCTVWKDGISINSKFYPKTEAKCKEAMKQIKKNLLPTALIPEIGNVDFEVDFKKAKYHA